MIDSIIYEVPFIITEKTELKKLNKDLYKLDKIIDSKKVEIEELMLEEIRKKDKSWKRISKWRRGYSLIYRFRVLLLKNYYDLTLRETESYIKENISARLFLDMIWDISLYSIPKYSTIQLWEQEFWESFTKEINNLLLSISKRKILKGRKSRSDTTVVEENVSYPTDSTLLCKWKDLLKRGMDKVWKILWWTSDKIKKNINKWIRIMKKSYLNIKKYSRKRKEESKKLVKKYYEDLINIAKSTVSVVSKEIKRIKATSKRKSHEIKQKLKKRLLEVEWYVSKVNQVIDQTINRVLNWKKVCIWDKLISYFSETAQIICKWKTWKPIEIWRKLSITECENGIITNWRLYEWNPNDVKILEDTIEDMKNNIWKVPKNNSYDRWFYDKSEKTRLENKYKVELHIPKRWKKSEEEKVKEKTWKFKTYQKFRAWWEWRISLLKRRSWLKKVRVRWKSVEIKVWWWILTDNMKIIAQKLI